MHSSKKTAGIIMTLMAALFLLHMMTGILINHATSLKLEQRFISWDWVMAHYDIGVAEPDAVFLVENKIFSQFGTQLFLDATPVTHLDRPILGGIALDDLIVLATDQALVLLTKEGEFLERMAAEAGVPAPVQNIGVYHGEPVIQARSGMWRSNFMLDVWEPMSLQGVSWSTPHPMPASVADDLQAYFYGKGVSVKQLLLDIHNGRFFGAYGVWLIDIMGLLLVVLSFSGLWMWGKRLK